jgi:hypothetical protein
VSIQHSAITDQLAKTVVEYKERNKSLKELCTNSVPKPRCELSGYMTVEEYGHWCAGFYEAMSVVLAHIESAQPAPRR